MPGAAAGALAENTEFSLIARATLEALYGNLLKVRLLEERMAKRRLSRAAGRSDEGWDAVMAAAVPVLMDIGKDDVVSAAEEMPVARLLRGEKAVAVVGEGQAPAEAGRMLLQLVGAALGNRTKKNGKVVLVFWRDAGQESWRDVLEMARVHTLPLILVCPAGGEPVARGDALEPGTELPRIVVDGFDAVAVYRVAHEAIQRARLDRGASLIECARFKVKGQRGGRGDAVANMERYLKGKGMLRRGMKDEVVGGFAKELRESKKRT